MISDWKNKKVAVLGLGIEGLSSAKYMAKLGAKVTVLDRKKEQEIDKDVLEGVRGVAESFVLGEQYLRDLEKYDVVVRSPGISKNRQELIDAEKKGVFITSQIKLFFDFCPCPIIGVTGTKGKGTTSTLIYEMLKAAGKIAYLGGNIGKPPLDFLDNLNPQSIAVLELSSFQLQDLDKGPHIAVVLMMTSEHLDYHGDTREYVDAKRNIIKFQSQNDFAILNRDYPATNESDIFTEAKVYHISRERGVDQGCSVWEKAVWLLTNDGEKKVIEEKDVLLPGKHNLENVCAACMAATLAGVSLEDIRKTLLSFKGLAHRIELAGEVRGVKYYDDSFSTTPETAIAAIEAFKQPEILILGGSSKKSDFTELGNVIDKAKNIKAIIGIGEEWEKIKSKIKDQKSKILLVEGARDMHQVVRAAAKIAESGDVVLLTPACASFGMFRNYKDRGEQFKREVNEIS